MAKALRGWFRFLGWIFFPYHARAICPDCGEIYEGWTIKIAFPILLHTIRHVYEEENEMV